MTAPALPGAAPDPARLPPEVEEALSFALADAPARGTCDELLLRTAIARALGGDGEPVAWLVVCRDGVTPGIAYLSREAAEEHIGVGETMRPLYTRPAATGDTGEVEKAVEAERSRNLDVLADFYSKTRAGRYASLSKEARQARLDVLTHAYSRMGGGLIHERADELDRDEPLDGAATGGPDAR